MLVSELVGRWYWIALVFVLGILGATYYLSKTSKQYTATATLLIKQQTATVMSRDQVEDIDLRSVEAMNTVVERIRRADLLERVASRQDVRDLSGLVPQAVNWMPEWLTDKLGATAPKGKEARQPPPPPAVLGGMISGWLQVTIRRGTRLVDVSISHTVPEVSKALADGIAREYLAEIVSTSTEGRGNTIDLLQKQSEEARTNLQSARGTLAIYARAIEVHKLLDAKEAEVDALRHRYLPKHPKLITATDELKRLQEQFFKEFEIARLAPNDKAYWTEAGRQLPNRDEQPDKFLGMARQQLVARIGVLNSEIDSSTSVFNSMLTRIVESNVNQESSLSSAEVNNLARVPGQPSAPIPAKVIAIGGVGGLVGGLMLALLLCRLDDRFHTVSQVSSEADAPLLAAIADINLRHLEASAREYLKNQPGEKQDYDKKWNERILFRPGASTTSYAEMYRILRASVSLLGDETRRKITLFTSALPGEGKTITSVNFSLAAAGQGRKTLLIDFDLRKPSVHKMFGLAREQERGGSTECLAGHFPFDQVIIRDTGVENFHLILAGKRAPNPGELLSTGRLNAILEEACRLYDVVVIDSAPLLAVPDTRILAPIVDNLCLVVRAEYVPKGAVRHALNVLKNDGTQLSGIIFNGFQEKRRLMGQNYSYGYYKTSRYGRAYRYGYGSYGAYGSEKEE